MAITGADDHTVRVWGLVSMAQVALLDLPAPCSALAVSDADWLVCAFASDIAVFGRHS